MYGASFVNAMVTDIIIRRLFVYFLINEQLFAPKYISQRLKRGQKECEKVSSKTTEKRRTGTRRFGALRLSAAQLSDAHSLIPSPPPPNNLPASPHTQSTFLQHLATLPNNLLELVVAFEMPLEGALARKSFILPTIFALS